MDTKKIQQNIIEEFGLKDLPEEKQTELLTAMTESVLKRITVKTLERLSDEDRSEFDKLKETDEPDKIVEFLREKISDYDQMVENIIKEFKEETKGTMGELEKELGEE